jgi:hypothetical protein
VVGPRTLRQRDLYLLTHPDIVRNLQCLGAAGAESLDISKEVHRVRHQ